VQTKRLVYVGFITSLLLLVYFLIYPSNTKFALPPYHTLTSLENLECKQLLRTSTGVVDSPKGHFTGVLTLRPQFPRISEKAFYLLARLINKGEEIDSEYVHPNVSVKGNTVYWGTNETFNIRDQSDPTKVVAENYTAHKAPATQNVDFKTLIINKSNGIVILTNNYTGWFSEESEGVRSEVYSCKETSGPLFTKDALELLEAIPEIGLIRKEVEKAGRKTVITTDGKDGTKVTVSFTEDAEDHLSRIATFVVDEATGLIQIYDVTTNQNISLADWQKQVRQSWGFK